MSITITPRLHLTRYGADSDSWSPDDMRGNVDQLESRVVLGGHGTIGLRPAADADHARMLYEVDDATGGGTLGAVYYCDGSTWTLLNPTAASAISPTLVDAKGDLIVGTADNTVARLARGATDQLLATAADGSLVWIDKPSGGAVINTRIEGSALVSAGGTTTVTITAVNVAKCQVRMNTSFTAASSGWGTVSVHLGSSTSLVITAAQASTSYTNVPVYYEIVEWT